MHAEREETVAQAIGNFRVEKWKQLIAAVDESHIYAERHEDGSVLATDHASANDGEAFRNAFHVKKSVGIERVHVVESNFGRTMRLGTGGDEDDFRAQSPFPFRTADNDRVRIFEGTLGPGRAGFCEVRGS